MIEGVASGEVFFAIAKYLVVMVRCLNFGGDKSDGRVVEVLEEDDGEFFTAAERLDEDWVWEEVLGFLKGFFRRSDDENAD